MSKGVIRTVYSLLAYSLLVLAPVYLFWRSRRNPGYGAHVLQRFGFVSRSALGLAPIWVHAVSVGETQAAVPLVKAIVERYPDIPILFTTMTPTGRDRARLELKDTVEHCFLPYDAGFCVARFLDLKRPRIGVIMETELWPNLFAACERRGVRLMLANARLSERSARGYRWVRPLIRQTLCSFSMIAAQSSGDAQRLAALGAPKDRLQVTGSIKFDVQLPASLREQAAALRRKLGVNRSVLIAASTHEGEETQVLDAFERIRAEVPDALLLLVPRHPERFSPVLALCRRRGFASTTRSANPSSCDAMAVFVGDSMGELPLFYAAADVAFVGGSLVPVGGHNMLEPSALGLPVVFGPHVFNFADISNQLCDAGAAGKVTDAASLAAEATALLRDANLRHQMGDRGREFVQSNRGALKRVVQLVDNVLMETGQEPGAQA